MVDFSAYLDADEDEDETAGGGDAADLAALKTCLKALADALASTNLAVVTSAAGDRDGAGRRVQASVEALKRFTTAFAILDGPEPDPPATENEEDDD